MTRISEHHRYGIAEKRVETAKQGNARYLEELSTQKSIREISDNPIGMTRALRYKDRIGMMNQQLKNMEFSKGFINKTESAVADIGENLMRAKELAVAMANDTYNSQAREASGKEVEEIMKQMVQLANSQYNGRYVFGGFRSQTPAMSADGDYLGDDGAVFMEISDGNFRQINVQARTLFEPNVEEQQKGHFGMINCLDTLHSGLLANDKFQIQKALEELDFQIDKATSFNASIGGISRAIEETQGRLEKERDQSKAGLSSVEDADAFHATSEFKRTETILQSTLLASNKMLQPSLLNFMQ